jgi:sec-independent protein translocase protein TatA
MGAKGHCSFALYFFGNFAGGFAMNFFGIGLPEMILIMVVALLIFGPKKLPEIGRTVGKAVKGFQDASNEFQSEFKREAELLEQMKAFPNNIMNPGTALTDAEIAQDTPQVQDIVVEDVPVEIATDAVASSMEEAESLNMVSSTENNQPV